MYEVVLAPDASVAANINGPADAEVDEACDGPLTHESYPGQGN
jgi:hypothetical protein